MPVGPRPQQPIGVGRLAVEGNIAGVANFANVFHVKPLPLAGMLTSDWNSIASQLLAAYQARFKSVLSTAVAIARCQGTLRTSADAAMTADINNSLGGLVSGTNLPASAACCISWKQSLYYRGGHPRTYLGGFVTTQQGNVREWTAAHRLAVENAAKSFRTDVNAITTPNVTTVLIGMLSYVENKEWRASPLFQPFNDATVDIRIDTQRRRLGPDV